MVSKLFLVSLLSLSTFTSSASRITSSQGTFGRDFFVGILAPWQIIRSGNATLLITSTNTAGNVNIHIPYLGININKSFTGYFEFSIPNSIIPGSNNTVDHRGIHVSTDIDVSLVVITSPNSDFEQAREAFLIMPTSIISSSYIISSYTSGQFWNSNFLILATESDTVVNITVSDKSLPVSVSMDVLDTYFYESQQDLSGTIVRSNKPIAVFSGHEATAVPHGCGNNHFMVEQLLPTSMFGHEFIVPPMPDKSGYAVRVYGLEENTTIKFTLSSRKDKRQLYFPGQFHEILGDDKPLKISSSKPVQVMLYSTCYSTNSSYSFGGSTMSIVPAMQQYANTYFFTVSAIFGNINHYVAIMANDTDVENGLRINGKKLQDLVQSNKLRFSGGTYVANIYRVQAGVYKLEHVKGQRFGAMQYGFGRGNEKAYSNVLGLITTADELTCLQCKDIKAPNMCYTITKCASEQVCYIEKFISQYGQVLYNMGCSDVQCTSLSRSRHLKGYFSKTSRPSLVCQHCCDIDLCNSYCNITTQTQPDVTIVG